MSRRPGATTRRTTVASVVAVALQASLSFAAVADPASLPPVAAETASSPATSQVLVPTAGDRLENATVRLAAAELDRATLDAASDALAQGGVRARREELDQQVAAEAARASAVLATVDGLALQLPARQVLTIGYHEARAEHLPLQPAGRPLGNWGLGPTPAATTGFDYVIMPTREREGSPTSAVDVVLPAGEDVLAPVSGRVEAVAPYLLYDEYEDVSIRIVPDGRPDLAITIYHVDGVRVREGQRIVAGETVLADSARVFEFIAQVEQWGRGPHVDLRVHRR